MRNSDKISLLVAILFELLVVVPLCYVFCWNWRHLAPREIYDVYADPIEFMETLRNYNLKTEHCEDNILTITSEYTYTFGPPKNQSIGKDYYIENYNCERVCLDTLLLPVREVRQRFLNDHPQTEREKMSIAFKYHCGDSTIEFLCHSRFSPTDRFKLLLSTVKIYNGDIEPKVIEMNSPEIPFAESRHYADLFGDSVLSRVSENICDRRWESFFNRFLGGS